MNAIRMEDSDPFEIHNKLLSDIITEYLDSWKTEERERNFTKWKLAFRNYNSSPYHQKCPILWDLYYLEDKKLLGIGKYDVLCHLLTEIGHARNRIEQAEEKINTAVKVRRKSNLDYPVSIEFKSRSTEPFYGDKVIMVAERVSMSDIKWCHVKESEESKVTTRTLDLRERNYIESTNEECTSTLVISEARFEDDGLYYLSSKTGERLSNQLSLKVIGDYPKVYVREITKCEFFGETWELEGHIMSTPPAKKISWWKTVDGKSSEINISQKKYTGSTTDIKRTPVLRIHKLDFGDEGSYVLCVENARGKGESKPYETKFNEDNSTRVTRYFQLILLGGKALKDVLERKTKPSLRRYLEENKEEISFLCSRLQMDQLFEGTGNWKHIDISTMYTLLKNMPDVESPSKGWGNTPEDEHILPADDIERIRSHYEYVARGGISSLSKTSFVRRWTELSEAIQRLCKDALNPQMKDIKHLKLDDVTIANSLKDIESNRKRELELLYQWKKIPTVEIQGLKSVNYLKRAELTGTIQSTTALSKIAWKKQNIEIDISGKRYSGSNIDAGDTGDVKLVIPKVKIEDIGEYHLLVENESGRARSNVLSLEIKEKKPKCEIVGEANRIVSLEQRTTLQGKIKTYPKLNMLQWRKVGVAKTKNLKLNRKKYRGSSEDHQKPTLVINNISVKDCGVYILHVENVKGDVDSNEIKIEIEGALPRADIKVGNSEEKQFICSGEIRSAPEPLSIKWQKIINNKAEDIDISLPKYRGSSDDNSSPKLVVRMLEPCDTAKYCLVVRNAIGEGRSNCIHLSKKFCSASIKANAQIQENKRAESNKYLNEKCMILNEMLKIVAKKSSKKEMLNYLSKFENCVSSEDVSESEAVDMLINNTVQKIKKWKNISDEKTHLEVLKRLLDILDKVSNDYNIRSWKCSRGSIIFDLEFADRKSFLRFQTVMKNDEMETTLSDIIVFEPLLEQLHFDLNKNDFSISIEYIQENPETAEIDSKPSTRSDFFAVAVDLGNTCSSYGFLDMSLLETATTYSLSPNNYGVLEKIPTALLLNDDFTFHLFGWKAKERYANLQGTEEAKRFHYFEHFITAIYETKAKSLDSSVSILDSEGRAVDAKLILRRCATYMVERAMRHIREEFAYVHLNNFKFCFTLPTVWASTKDFLMDALSEVPHGENQISILLESHAACMYYHLRADEETDIRLENSFQKLGKGDKYMIVDIGGETTDISVHLRSDFDEGLDKVLIPCTGPWGGNYINQKLIDLLCEKYKLKQPIGMKTRHHLIEQFHFSMRRPGIDRIRLQRPNIREEMILENHELDQLFEEPLQKIQQLLQEVFNKEKVDVVILMGGFLECERVQIAVQEIFGNKTVIKPDKPGLAMLEGALCHLKHLEDKSLQMFTVTM